MNLTNWHESDREALRAFYSTPGQLWTWSEMESGANAAGRTASEWFETGPAPKSFPVLLPRVTVDSNGQTRLFWYAIAFNPAQSEQLRSELWAFVGPVASDFHRRSADFRDQDDAEAILRSWSRGPWIYRFEVIDNTRKEWIRASLRRLRFIWTKHPVGIQTRFRTTEELLRNFHSSLINGDEVSSEQWLQELRDGGRLSAENLLFLRVERLAAFERWDDLLLHPQWSLLRQMRRPRQVTARMVEALWHVKLRPFLDRNDSAGVVTYVREHILPENGVLFRNRGQASSPQIVLAFMLAAASTEMPQRDRVENLLVQIPESTPERSFAESVLSFISDSPEKQQRGDVEYARKAIENNDYEGAWAFLQKLTPSIDSVRMLLVCAYEFDTVEAAHTVNAALESIGEQAKVSVFKNNRAMLRNWEELKKRLEESPDPSDWESWLHRLDANPDWNGAVPAAREGARLWPLNLYHENPTRVARLAEMLFVDRNGPAKRSLRLALPHLIDFFLPENRGISEFQQMYSQVLLLMALLDEFSSEDFALTQTLLEAILETGANAGVYQEAVQSCAEIWQTHGSAHTLDWAIETLDNLASRPTPQPSARDAFFDLVRTSFQKLYRRVRADQWELFGWLCGDLGRSAEFAAMRRPNSITETGDTPRSLSRKRLDGQLVAIYTLTQSAGERAKQMLEAMFDGLTVRLSNDLVGSDQLRALARHADWFLLATRSAKHAATEFIKAERPQGKRDILYSSGKGASSLVSALLAALLD